MNGLSELDDVQTVAGTRSIDGVDFDDPASLPGAFEGVDVLLVVSAGYAGDDVVLARHGAVDVLEHHRRTPTLSKLNVTRIRLRTASAKPAKDGWSP